ncbi:MAG: hypothetical protein JNM53_03620 [Gemmatimonadetes bacterium]|nr:hypothetical protein [Gemmatimonadota bacterium]
MGIRPSAIRALLLMAAPLLLACRMERTPAPPTDPAPEPPTPVGLDAGGEINRARVLEVARSQQYDVNPGSSHRAVLDYGVEATIEPTVGAYRNPKDGFDRGVIVARFVNNSDSTLSRLGLLPRGTTYWFIYRKDGQLFSAYIPDIDTDKHDVRGVPTIAHPPTRPWRQSVAQWQLPGILDKEGGLGALGVAAGGQLPWVTCEGSGCCKPST